MGKKHVLDTALVDEVFGPAADSLARDQVDHEMVRSKGSLLPKEQLITQKKQQILTQIQHSMNKTLSDLLAGVEIIKTDGISILSKESYKTMIEELTNATTMLAQNPSLFTPPDVEGSVESHTFQQILQLSDATMKSFYTVGYDHYQRHHYVKSAHVFLALNLLNPFVRDYWIARGLAEQQAHHYPVALEAFAMAILLNPDEPFARFYSAECYISDKHPKDAEIEIEELERIVSATHQKAAWEKQISHLKQRIHKAK